MEPHRDDARLPVEHADATPDAIGFRTIVAPLDGSPGAEGAVPLAVHVALIERATLVLVRVVPYPEPPVLAPSHGSSGMCIAEPPPEIADAFRDAGRYLDRIARQDHAGLTIRSVVLIGDPLTRIVNEIGRWSRPLVLLSAHAADVPSAGDRSDLARRIASLPGIHVLVVPHEAPLGEPAANS